MSHRLTNREREIANVAADLLMKGDPSTRIAFHCYRKKMTFMQVARFVEKLPVMHSHGMLLSNAIICAFHCIDERPDIWTDESMANGKFLKKQLKEYEKVN